MEPNFKNEVVFQGKISGIKIVRKNAMAIVTLKTKKTREKSDYPSIIFFENTFEKVLEFKKGDFVVIHAMMQSKPRTIKNEITKEPCTYYRQSIIGKDIKKNLSVEEKNGEKEGRVYENKNEVILRGKVSSIKDYEDRLSTALYVVSDGRPNRIVFSVFKDKSKNNTEVPFEKGDWILVVGEIQTLPAKGNKQKKETIIAKGCRKCDQKEEDN